MRKKFWAGVQEWEWCGAAEPAPTVWWEECLAVAVQRCKSVGILRLRGPIRKSESRCCAQDDNTSKAADKSVRPTQSQEIPSRPDRACQLDSPDGAFVGERAFQFNEGGSVAGQNPDVSVCRLLSYHRCDRTLCAPDVHL
jgi:hypothetical protein